MSNFCLKCGKLLEKDGFCLKCIEFANNDILKEAIDINTAVSMEQPSDETEDEVYVQTPNEIYLEQKPKNNVVKKLLLGVIAVGMCVAGIYVFSGLLDNYSKKSVEDDTGAYQTFIEEQDLDKSKEEEEISDDQQESYVYEADYDEIMQAGEPSNAYTLFEATKNDVVPIIEEYFIEQGVTMNYETHMDNTYEMVDNEEITFYETFSIWTKEQDDSELYFISSDTVTGKLLYVAVYRENEEEAIQLIKKSLETIDPNLTTEQLQETCVNIADSIDYVDEICGDYEVQGEFLEEQNLYCYYITSLHAD